MKFSLLFVAALLGGTTAVHAQKINPAQVPAPVKATLTARFPEIKTAIWKKETQKIKQAYDYETHSDFWAREAFSTQDIYETEFKLNGQKMSIVIIPTGLI